MPNTPIFGWPYQALTDAPDGAKLGEELALAIEGTLSGVDSTSRDQDTSTGTTTSTVFTSTLSGGTPAALTFVAPTSGRVMIINSCQLSTTSGTATCAVEVREGATIGAGSFAASTPSGAASTTRAVRNGSTANVLASFVDIFEELTPGATYNAQQVFATSAGTATFSNKQLNVVPLL